MNQSNSDVPTGSAESPHDAEETNVGLDRANELLMMHFAEYVRRVEVVLKEERLNAHGLPSNDTDIPLNLIQSNLERDIQSNMKLVSDILKAYRLSDKSGSGWVGKYRILVEKIDLGDKSDFYIFDLKHNSSHKVGGFLFNHYMSGGLTLVEETNTVYALGNPSDLLVSSTSARYGEVHEPAEEDHINDRGSFMNLADKKWNTFTPSCPPGPPTLRCTSFGSTIFSYGPSSTGNPKRPWTLGHFCDTASKEAKWCYLNSPPIKPVEYSFSSYGPLIHDPSNERLLGFFNAAKSIYAYYPATPNQQWDLVADDVDIGFGGFEPATSIVDGVLYVYGNGHLDSSYIGAYDIVNKRNLQVKWSSHYPFGPDKLFGLDSSLLHLGDNILCLYSTVDDGSNPDEPTDEPYLDFYRFQVCRSPPDQVRLDPLSFHHVPLSGFRYLLTCIPL